MLHAQVKRKPPRKPALQTVAEEEEGDELAPAAATGLEAQQAEKTRSPLAIAALSRISQHLYTVRHVASKSCLVYAKY